MQRGGQSVQYLLIADLQEWYSPFFFLFGKLEGSEGGEGSLRQMTFGARDNPTACAEIRTKLIIYKEIVVLEEERFFLHWTI